MGCRAKLGIQVLGGFYYDLDVIKVRKCVLPFIIWVKEHREELRDAALMHQCNVTDQNGFTVDSRRFYMSEIELKDEESCFCINIDNDYWRESGTTPCYLDWGEVWEFSKYMPPSHHIFWNEVPDWDQYRATRLNALAS